MVYYIGFLVLLIAAGLLYYFLVYLKQDGVDSVIPEVNLDLDASKIGSSFSDNEVNAEEL